MFHGGGKDVSQQFIAEICCTSGAAHPESLPEDPDEEELPELDPEPLLDVDKSSRSLPPFPAIVIEDKV